jgi:hypothetical protein
VAFCPAPPVLLPAVAGAAVDTTASLRSACADAVAAALARGPEAVVVVAAGEPGVRYGAGDSGSLRGFGVDLDVPFDGPALPGGRSVPLPHTVGAWLLDQAGWRGRRHGVSPDDLGAALDDMPAAAVLVMGDGSARRTVKAPGYLDPAAEPFDAAVAGALRDGDARALAGLDPAEGDRLLAEGVPAWRALGRALDGRPVDARLRYDDAPFGVGYLVADWRVG